ncbi:MAG: C39 family peptidase [Patescibacteria group bacterium]
MKVKTIILFWIIGVLAIAVSLSLYSVSRKQSTPYTAVTSVNKNAAEAEKENESKIAKTLIIPKEKTLKNINHVFQTFNNCGPASLSMALSFYGINKSQTELGQQLRPYQNPQGDNDDKSVTLEELAKEANKYGFATFHRPAGNIEMIKKFVAYDMPVITRTWLKPNDDIGHYRVVKGYDEDKGILIQDDSLQGKDLEYSHGDFNEIWKMFNYEYLVLVPNDKVEIAKGILQKDVNEDEAWKKAVKLARQQLEQNENDTYARFNLSVALYNIKEYEAAIKEFEQVETLISKRTLWYQIEPILAYYEIQDYERVFTLTNEILNNNNRAFSELYIVRGNIYRNEGKISEAKSEYEKALNYNVNLEAAKQAINSL